MPAGCRKNVARAVDLLAPAFVLIVGERRAMKKARDAFSIRMTWRCSMDSQSFFRPGFVGRVTRQLRRAWARDAQRSRASRCKAFAAEPLEQRSMMAVVVANPAAADIVGFNPATDRLDFGDVSVHNLIVAKTEAGEPAIVNPWAWSPQFQVMKGVGFGQLSAETFGVVQNEHLRQDIGGVLSWEKGVGPRLAGTVYVRSHEYGMQEKVVGFDPAANKLSFLYFGTRERLSVTDTAEGLLISVEPTKQSLLLVGVTKASLVPGNLEFHHDQVIEDQLEVPFGVTSDQVALVSRAALLTPNGPAGQPTDGLQTRAGMTGAVTTAMTIMTTMTTARAAIAAMSVAWRDARTTTARCLPEARRCPTLAS